VPSCLLLALFLTSGGCTSAPTGNGADAVFIITGVGGDSGYGPMVDALARPNRTVQVIAWGSPMFMMNFSTESIHDEAETMLAKKIDQWHADHPDGQIDLVGHSAGCGVALGSLPRLTQAHVHNVILLAPSVSPSYDLNPPLQRVDGAIHVFYSDRDDFFLDWRTSNFGTYDRVKSKAAGNEGFPTGKYPAEKVIQHPYDPTWEKLGNDGGHYGVQADAFCREVIASLLPAR